MKLLPAPLEVLSTLHPAKSVPLFRQVIRVPKNVIPWNGNFYRDRPSVFGPGIMSPRNVIETGA